MGVKQTESLHTYWKQQVSTWQSSGLSQAAFCEKHELVYHRFIYWKSKFTNLNPRPASLAARPGFVKVHQVSYEETHSDLSLTLPNGMVLSGFDSTNLGLVRQLLECLS